MPSSKFSAEFKEQVVLEVVEKTRPIVEVAKSYGLVPQTVGNWVSTYRKQHPDPGTEQASPEELAQVKQLKQQLAESRMENEFLKKAAAFFAKETHPT